MKISQKLKFPVDIVMTMLLPLLMAYSLVGEAFHEWAGGGMLLLFLLHQGCNWRWYRRLLHGKYHALRIVSTLLNIAMLILILLLMSSGITMSRYAFAFLPLNGSVSAARTLHLAASYWYYVLASIHIGLHGNLLLGRLRKTFSRNPSASFWRIIRILCTVLCMLYGLYAFRSRGLAGYMLLQSQFVWIDYTEPLLYFLLDYLAIMALFALSAAYITGLILHRKRIYRGKETGA